MFHLDKDGEATLGRAANADIRLLDDGISRLHCRVRLTQDGLLVEDLKSRNGTIVNGERVSSKVLINNDIISLGDHRIKFIDPSARRRTTLRGAGWDDTTIAESIKDFRNTLANHAG